MKIFLSHSSKDKDIVTRIDKDLKSHSYETWIDNEQIPFGGSIIESIEDGLTSSDVLIIFLSQNSVLSKWVQNEWRTKFFMHADENSVHILPLLLSDCEVPRFLNHIRYLDFRKKDNYEHNLSNLLDALNQIKLARQESNFVSTKKLNYSILSTTIEMLDELRNEYIALPTYKRIPLIETLRRIGRSGKLVRLYNFTPQLKIRSVYDHILSVAHSADCLLPYVKSNITKEEYNDLARCIAFHELSEVVLGDIPIYTSLDAAKREKSRIFAEQRLRSVDPQRRRQIATDFIWLFLNEKHRKSLEKVNMLLSNSKSNIYIAFKIFDKVDPIIATWRYLNFYRGKLGDTPRLFNSKMKDFYENPDVKNFLRANKVDQLVLELVNFLQDRTNSWDYYESATKPFSNNRMFDHNQMFGIRPEIIRNTIEGIPLFCDDIPSVGDANNGDVEGKI